MQTKKNAYAKINLTLDVVGKRPDGYHEIESVMQTLSLHDIVCVSVDKNGADVNDIHVECDGNSFECDEKDNICYKSADAFLNYFNIKGVSVLIKITKRIPVAAGLGGGSSDGAETIKALNELLEVNAGTDELQRIAAKVGADVAFFIRGGTQLASGIGDVLTPLKAFPKKYVLIAKPSISMSSGNIYGVYDKLGGEREAPCTKKFLAAGDDVLKYTNNMLEAAVLSKPDTEIIPMLEKKMTDCGAESAHMAGSGSAVYGIFKDYAYAVVSAALIRQEFSDIEFCDVVDIYNVK